LFDALQLSNWKSLGGQNFFYTEQLLCRSRLLGSPRFALRYGI